MKTIRVEDAVGSVLAHDMTRIIPGRFKGVGFKKGHVVAAADIPELLKMGKSHLYVLELLPEDLHEDQAALRIAAAVSGPNLAWGSPCEGKSSIQSTCEGLLRVNIAGLRGINQIGDLILATLKTGTPCRRGQTVAATRIIPLTISRALIEALEALAAKAAPVLEITPYRRMRFGGLVTGSELHAGLIQDEFDRYVGQKAQDYGCTFVRKIIVPDDPGRIAAALGELVDLGCELILTTGGLSVDPDDVTRMGVRLAGAEVIAYGSPILPGAMFLYARLGETQILGLPACVYYHPTTVFDLMLPRVLAGEPITRETIADMGHGGLCLGCPECRYPVCPFGP